MWFCAVMMTSFAFIVGVYSLPFAAGAAEIVRSGLHPPGCASKAASRLCRIAEAVAAGASTTVNTPLGR
jgi:hypothetical protein